MRIAATAAAVCLLVGAAAGCGGDDSDDSGASAPAGGADLRVSVRAEGKDGPAKTRTIRCDELGTGTAICGVLETADLSEVPSTTACPQIFGGPATATVKGTLKGDAVNLRFDLTDGCEIERWRSNAALLGDPPGNPPGG